MLFRPYGANSLGGGLTTGLAPWAKFFRPYGTSNRIIRANDDAFVQNLRSFMDDNAFVQNLRWFILVLDKKLL
jgi:hypothetical protein